MMKNNEVTQFLKEQNHPLIDIIDILRKSILSADKSITENIKWNGPNYCSKGEDRITMKIFPPKNIQLIFHRGAKKQVQPKDKLLTDDSGLMVWKENDRAVMTFKTIDDVKAHSTELKKIVVAWIKATE